MNAPFLSSDDLPQVFPFHLAWDRNGQIIGAGDAITRIFGDLSGTPIDDSFRGEIGFSDGSSLADGPDDEASVLLLSHRVEPLRLRGTLLERDGWLFFGSPVAISFEDLKAQGILLDDLPHHDGLRDALFREQSQRVALDDARKLAERLRRQRRELKALSVEAQRANAAKSQFLANVSHEIRTPMTAILGYADLLHEEISSPELLEESITTIRRNGRHLLALINDILDLSRLEAERIELESVRVDVVALLAEVRDLLHPTAVKKGLDFQLRAEGPIPRYVESDPTRLRQILVNLVGNAIKFTEKGSVEVCVCFEDESPLKIEVTDSGCGMSEEQLVRVFEPFVQADASTTRKYGGTGLGLAISKRLAEALGGSLNATSEPESGSCFHIELPLGNVVEQRLISPDRIDWCAQGIGAHTGPLRSLSGLTLLLAEDGEDNIRLIVHLLEKAGAVVDVAENGQLALDAVEARETAGESPYSVILMDMQMPVLDGYETTSVLREKGYAAPIVALTANAMASDREKCLAAGCDEFATKPIEREDLLTKILEQAGRIPQGPPVPEGS